VLHLRQECQVLCYLRRPCLRPRIRLLQQLQVQEMATVRRRQHPGPIFPDTVPTIQALTACMLRGQGPGQHLRRMTFQDTARALILRHGQPPRQPLFGRAAILGSLTHYFSTNDCNRCMQRRGPTLCQCLWPVAAAPQGSGNTMGWPGLMDSLDWNHAS
jgi:hypothetical protein